VDTPVRLRPGLRLTLQIEGRQLKVQLPDREVLIPDTLADAVRAATSGVEVSADSLPGLAVSDGLKLLRRLLREGVVVPV